MASDLLRGLVCVPPPTTMTALVLSRGVDQRAQTPTSLPLQPTQQEMVALQRATSNVRGAGSMLHSKSRYAPQSADSEQLIPTLRDLASRAHRWEAQLLFNLKEAAQM